MAHDATNRPQDHGTSDALQNFAHTIQEKAEAPLENGEREVVAERARTGRVTSPDSVTGTSLATFGDFLRRNPVVGVVSGMALGFAIGRLRK